MINSGKIKITKDGNIIMQFSNYHHVIDSDTEFYYKKQVDKEISDLKRLNHDLCERVTENDEIRQHWEEIEQTTAENAMLKAKLAEKDAEIAQLQAMLEERNKQVGELKEDRRWRKCSEELPLAQQRVLFLAKYKTDKVREWIGCFRHIDGMKADFATFYASAPGWGCEFLIDEVIGWMPMPSAPKEANK